jgi:hypothetical protein
MRPGRTRVHLLSLALAACGLLATTATATPITNGADYTYTTSGAVLATWPAGAGQPNIQFQGVSDSTGLVAPGSFTLGSFQVGSISGPSAQFSSIPFQVTMSFQPKDPSVDMSSAKVVVNGVLNGTIFGNKSSDLTATITGVTGTGPVPFDLSQLTVLAPQILSPAGVNGGSTALNAYLGTLPQPPSIPEPTTLAIFGVVLALAGARRLRRSAIVG